MAKKKAKEKRIGTANRGGGVVACGDVYDCRQVLHLLRHFRESVA
jgi:hypothetical protein